MLAVKIAIGELTRTVWSRYAREQDVPDLEPLFNSVSLGILSPVLFVQLCPLDFVNAFFERCIPQGARFFALSMFGQLVKRFCTITSFSRVESLFAPLTLNRRVCSSQMLP